MASKKRRASSSRPYEPYDTSRFVSEIAWERYETNFHRRNILLKQNIELAYSHYDEFLQELERRQWHKNLTRQMENRIDLAMVKEFYSNLYDLEDRSPKKCKVWGKMIKFDATTRNTFLETSVVLEPGERYSTYS